MLNHKITRKIGKQNSWRSNALGFCTRLGLGLALVLTLSLSLDLGLDLTSTRLGQCSLAYASEVEFSAEVDRSQLTLSDTVTLNLLIRTHGNAKVSEPQIIARGFEEVSNSKSVSVSTQYDSSLGQISMENVQQITKVLQPSETLKPGKYEISGIQVEVDGKLYKANPIELQIIPGGGQGGGQGSAPPPSSPGYSSPSYRMSRPNSAIGRNTPNAPNARSAQNAMLRAEVAKNTAYKGEQLIVSYYFYHQGKVFNLQVEKFPILSGFLREDLDMPIITQRMEPERVTLNGVPYERWLLARYAAYPIQEGKLTIDSMAVKFNYYSNLRNSPFGEEDPFFGFFQQLSPRVGSAQSEKQNIDVKSLPSQGRPENFVGGVGDFQVTSAVDKYEVRANEAVTLTVKVEGRGNYATLEEPKNKWPETIELYDSKGRSQAGSQGVGEKVFEFLLIPRVPGKLELPPLQFGFFDPNKNQYYTQSTEAIQLHVLEPAPGSALVPIGKNKINENSHSSNPGAKVENLRDLKSPTEIVNQKSGLELTWHLLYWGWVVALGAFIGFVGVDLFKRGATKIRRLRRAKIGDDLQQWSDLQSRAKNASLGASSGASWQEISELYELLTEAVFDEIDKVFQVGARGFSRAQLGDLLVQEKGLPAPLWSQIVALLEYAETVRFASSLGNSTESSARSDLIKWVSEAELVAKSLKACRSFDSH